VGRPQCHIFLQCPPSAGAVGSQWFAYCLFIFSYAAKTDFTPKRWLPYFISLIPFVLVESQRCFLFMNKSRCRFL
jgi:hypothetical protein